MTPIGIFDSGYGGLTILKEIRNRLPQYDYLYLGDNARAPYGARSFDIVYDFTLQAVRHLFDAGCRLVILACNTASAKALRSIQQRDLPLIDPERRVLGVIIPTVEALDAISATKHVGVVATPGTIMSHSYRIETAKLFPQISLSEVAAPMWVPIIENGEADGPGADYFVKKYCDEVLAADPLIDTLLLGCTHYPILLPKIRRYMPERVNIIPQGRLVADSLADYLDRHPEMAHSCSKSGTMRFLTTEAPDKFNRLASLFLDSPVEAARITLQ
ncbi:MAG: glutamate racemase [Muribaculaceae bacterium]|nr:glutamate racemase [Muribaculaceae bacterium]MDE5957566.1 glutamate racemase [Muribaculaceae bacterium]